MAQEKFFKSNNAFFPSGQMLSNQILRDKFIEVVLDPESDDYVPTGINDYIGITIDFETGGLPRADLPISKIGITQIAMNAFRLKDLQMVSRMSFYIYPYNQLPEKKLKKKDAEIDTPSMIYEQEALDFTNISMSKLREQGIDIKEAGDLCLDFINMHILTRGKTGLPSKSQKPFFLGQNIPFDMTFWSQLMEHSKNTKIAPKYLDGMLDYYGNFQPRYVDTLPLARAMLCTDDSVQKYSLSSLCDRLGFPIFDAHDAGADTDATFNVFAYMVGKMRGAGGSITGAAYEQEKERLKFKI